MKGPLTLALTKIGDLLLDHKITQAEDGNPMEGINLQIPEYQRPYKWNAQNANQLLDDIEEAREDDKEVYRVGTLILHHDVEDNTYNIVDGQQRTITFALLLKVCNENVDLTKLHLANNSFNRYNVSNNYRTLKRRINSDKLGESNFNRLRDYIKNNCELIVVITDDLSEAFQFFDSQNARGKELYPHDLLKAYHLREMNNLDSSEIEKIVSIWENLDQKYLSLIFKEYLYRLKEWMKGNKAGELNEHNIDMFKGVSVRDNYPYAQFYKGAFSYADDINRSSMAFVTGIHKLSPFQLNTPVVAGKPFFDYTKHYFDILSDIQNNDKYEGYFIKDNDIIRTLNLRKYKNGVGNRITRLMLDTAILLYVDRFCPDKPSQLDTDMLDQYVVMAFIWAYSMRAQYSNVGWLVAQNYIMGIPEKDVVNSFNIYKVITDAESPNILLSRLADILRPISSTRLRAKTEDWKDKIEGVQQNYLYYFNKYRYWEGK